MCAALNQSEIGIDRRGILTSIVQEQISAKKDTYVAFVDFSKAYDKVDRQKLWQNLNTLGVSGHIIQVLRALYQNVQCCVSVNSVKSRWFPVAVGLKQGCMLSPLLIICTQVTWQWCLNRQERACFVIISECTSYHMLMMYLGRIRKRLAADVTDSSNMV